jgi:hypothetical protein
LQRKIQCSYISSILTSCSRLLLALAIEPEWERKFSKQDQNTYRFRIYTSDHDIVENIRKRLQNPAYFTNIVTYKVKNFGYVLILEKMRVNQQSYNMFRTWFKKNFLKKDKKTLIEIRRTIYQKNVESFFFRNILMYGLEQILIEDARKKIRYLKNFQISKQKWIKNFRYFRFDKDFIIFSPNRRNKIFQKSRLRWLIKVGFDLKKKINRRSTRKNICFLNKKAIESIIFPGFAICGFFIQHYKFKTTAYLEEDLNIIKKENYKIYIKYQITITPSKKELKKHLNKMSYIIFILGKNTYYRTLIKNINPIMWNWCNYFRYYNCQNRFQLRQYITFCMLKQWNKKTLEEERTSEAIL